MNIKYPQISLKQMPIQLLNTDNYFHFIHFGFTVKNNFISWRSQIKTEFGFSDSEYQKICVSGTEFVFLQFPSHTGIQRPSAANYFVRGNARARCRWQSITETQPKDEEHGDNHWRLKGFCLLTPKPVVSKIWWDLLISRKLECSVTLVSVLLGDAVFLPLGAVDPVWWWEMSGLHIFYLAHLHPFTAPSQSRCPGPHCLPVSFRHSEALSRHQGWARPPSSPDSFTLLSFLPEPGCWGRDSFPDFPYVCCSNVKHNKSPFCAKGDATPCWENNRQRKEYVGSVVPRIPFARNARHSEEGLPLPWAWGVLGSPEVTAFQLPHRHLTPVAKDGRVKLPVCS